MTEVDSAFRPLNFCATDFEPENLQIGLRWETAYQELSNLIKFGTSLNSQTFRLACKKWLHVLKNIQSESKVKLPYNAMVHVR